MKDITVYVACVLSLALSAVFLSSTITTKEYTQDIEDNEEGEYAMGSASAKGVEDILNVPCMKLPSSHIAWRYSTPIEIDYTNIDGVLMKYHCPGLDTVLWDSTTQRAYWVNPFTFIAGVLNDLLDDPDSTRHTPTRAALHKELKKAYERRREARSADGVEPGCVNYDYSRTRSCFGRRSPWFANTSAIRNDRARADGRY
ncbi:envelope glycoprotein L [Bovine alphaherpesvirus 2]|uniref:Envelope glycoprotein L n=1 Tax=Bovine alphaherpesvirus 2 TaxID=10295 RepID=A0ABX6WNL8_9ALPH|nr:envelope glycoprotein L [Bovine alphaherpesvirus 2]QPO25134.1 envelope glycoprotein L [Bovine alphaherpesvirus 2]